MAVLTQGWVPLGFSHSGLFFRFFTIPGLYSVYWPYCMDCTICVGMHASHEFGVFLGVPPNFVFYRVWPEFAFFQLPTLFSEKCANDQLLCLWCPTDGMHDCIHTVNEHRCELKNQDARKKFQSERKNFCSADFFFINITRMNDVHSEKYICREKFYFFNNVLRKKKYFSAVLKIPSSRLKNILLVRNIF